MIVHGFPKYVTYLWTKILEKNVHEIFGDGISEVENAPMPTTLFKDFLATCLDVNIKTRLTAVAASDQPWMNSSPDREFGGRPRNLIPDGSFDEYASDESPMLSTPAGQGGEGGEGGQKGQGGPRVPFKVFERECLFLIGSLLRPRELQLLSRETRKVRRGSRSRLEPLNPQPQL